MIETPKYYILTMSCVSGDNVQCQIFRYQDIFNWLKKLDHEGSSWDCEAVFEDHNEDITNLIIEKINELAR